MEKEKPLLFATHSGILTIGDLKLRCFVLNNEDRVIIMRDMVELLTGHKKGGLDRYTNAEGVRKYMPQKFVDHPHKEVAIVFTSDNRTSFGYKSGDIMDIFNGYIKAREAGSILPSQAHLAEKAEWFKNAYSKLGLDAHIDEATKYQDFRDSMDLQTRINIYLQEEYREWTRTFPRVFFDQLYKLEGIPVPIGNKPYPKRFGKYVMQFVYDTLDPKLADYLRTIEVKPEGSTHYWQLFNDFGYKKLTDHLMSVLGIMKASPTKERFVENIRIAFPFNQSNRVKRLRANKEKRHEEEKAHKKIEGAVSKHVQLELGFL